MSTRFVVLNLGHKLACEILRAGVPKHHILNANLFRNGADFAVFVNTAQEFDGSDSGDTWNGFATPFFVFGQFGFLSGLSAT